MIPTGSKRQTLFQQEKEAHRQKPRQRDQAAAFGGVWGKTGACAGRSERVRAAGSIRLIGLVKPPGHDSNGKRAKFYGPGARLKNLGCNPGVFCAILALRIFCQTGENSLEIAGSSLFKHTPGPFENSLRCAASFPPLWRGKFIIRRCKAFPEDRRLREKRALQTGFNL